MGPVQDRMPPPLPSALDSRAELFSREVLAWFWPFGREEPHGHPPFYAIVALLGDVLAPWWEPLPRARLGTMLALSLAAGAVYAACRKRWGGWPAATASAAFVLQPRLFAEGHYATYDALLTSLWVGAILSFAAAVDGADRRSPRWGWAVVFGVLAGWAADTKLTGWFLPLPFLGWLALRAASQWRSAGSGRPDESPSRSPTGRRPSGPLPSGRGAGRSRAGRGDTSALASEPPLHSNPLACVENGSDVPSLAGRAELRKGLQTLSVGAGVAVLTLYLFNPPWWPDPITGVLGFFTSNLSRAETIPIQTLFLGEVYNTPIDSLPWYNTLAWTLFVVPAGFLALALVGAVRAAAGLVRGGASPLAPLALVHWAFFLALRSLPHTPGHDGVRQFLPAFGCLALLVAPGVDWLMGRSIRWGKAIASAAMAEGVLSVAVMMPVPLSYYSPIVGGLPGAARLGMEPTYYWDALTPAAVDWLNRHTPTNRTVLFATNPTSWFYLRETGKLRPGIAPFDPGRPLWYVVQNRPGAMRPVDRRLVERSGGRHVISSKLGVPLVWAFPFEAFQQAQAVAEPPR
jgi:hypothetical protein